MNRMFRVLGSTLVAAAALTAVLTSTASATPSFTASAYPATFTGSNTKGAFFTTEAGTVQCDSHVEGTLSAGSGTWTYTPRYENCSAFGFMSATVNTEECHHLFHALFKIGPFYFGRTTTACTTGKSIKITAGTCKAEIGSQENEGVEFSNSGSGLTVQYNLTNIAMTVTADGFLCPFNGTGAKTASFHGDLLLSRKGGGSVSMSGE